MLHNPLWEGSHDGGNPCTCSLLIMWGQHMTPIKQPGNGETLFSGLPNISLNNVPPCSWACIQYVRRATRGLNHSGQVLPTHQAVPEQLSCAQSNCQKSGGSILCTTQPPKKGGKKVRSVGNYLWIGQHRSFARSTKSFWSSDPDLSINQKRVHFTKRQELGHLVQCPLQSNDDCGFYNYFWQLLTGLPTVLMNHRLATIVW